MDIERLKELKAEFEQVRKYNDRHYMSTVIEDDVIALIDEAIARQSVKSDMGETSDGYHTFNELYEHRTALFATLCNMRSDISWKSMKHDDGTMYDGMFIAGIETPDGQYTYHCDMKYLYMFAYTPEVDKAPPYDGHQPKDYPRLLGLSENSLYRQNRQSVKSEDVAEAIEWQVILKDYHQNKWGKTEPEWQQEPGAQAQHNEMMKAIDLAITALQAYQPKPESTIEDVLRAIDWLETGDFEIIAGDEEYLANSSHHPNTSRFRKTAITALQAYQPEPPKGE